MNVKRWMGLVVVFAFSVGLTASAQQGDPKKEDKPGEKKETPQPAQSGDAAPAPKFEKGKSYWQEMTTKTEQKMKVQGMDIVQTQKQTFVVEWITKDVVGSTVTVDYKIKAVKMDIEIGGNKISYDSHSKAKEQPDNPLTQFFKALVDASFEMTIEGSAEKGWKVKDVKKENVDAFVTKLAQANEQLKPLLQNILTPETLKEMAQPTFAVYPSNKKEWDDGNWKYNAKLNMGPIGMYDTTYTYTHSKDKDTKDNIILAVNATMTYAPPAKSDGGLPFTIVPKNDKDGVSKLTADKATGTVELDKTTGLVAKSNMTMELTGMLIIDIAGVATPVNLTQTQTSTVTGSKDSLLPK